MNIRMRINSHKGLQREGELNDLLAKLSQVNEEMSGFAVGAGSGQSAAIHHTLQRHTEILQDYRSSTRPPPTLRPSRRERTCSARCNRTSQTSGASRMGPWKACRGRWSTQETLRG